MNVGFLGLGTMGKPMAMNLLKAGYRLQVWNRSQDPVAALRAAGAQAAASAREAAENADILISMLADDAATRIAVLDGGVLDALKPGAIHINMATVSVTFADECERLHREKGIGYIAAPVLGRVNVAEAGQLNILAAGAPVDLARVQALFDVLGQKTWRIGERPSQANAVKLAVNFMIGSAIGTMAEAATLARGFGVAKADFIDLVTSTAFAMPVYKGYGGAMAAERFEPAGFKLSLGAKDIKLALEAAETVNVPLPLASVLRDNHLDALAHGEGHLDWAAVSRVAGRRAAQES
ncbi:NAD(P)-dependent oxidoreductase [Methylovirgula sp. 4M-Z18]|uniref:NAD(P)-dependent oxidoreductase n=1 Tax=Methylovirgula sp. 4M-Z18 TaxID=2293567 RepID=UPI000E2F22BB|nr:NAD(P)-dependent oxidoreductase [Methylovirgula sp. 4M-Z18]RFB75716.1 NAD(P)-dependent oxidoreductase [Methylovirgula sp. 4M-Z18]